MNQLLLFIVFFTVIASLFGLMQYRLYRLLRRWAAKVYSRPVSSTLVRRTRWALLLNIFFVAQLFIRGTTFYDIPLIQVVLVYPMGLFFAMVVLAFLVTTATDALRFLKWTGSRLVRIASGNGANPVALSEPLLDSGRRKFLRLGGLSAASVIGTLPIVASTATARDYQIKKIPLSFENLPAALEGFTVAQVSDIHSGIYMTESNMREIFEIVNPLNAQAIMVTGDFVDSSDSQIEPLYKAIEMLKAEYRIFGCLGNHDHFANAQKVSAAVEQRGITMLNNSHVSIDIDGEKLGVIGIDDAGRGQSDFSDWSKALEGMNPDSFKIALTHRPDEWDRTRLHAIDLTLAGHTHGGQICLPGGVPIITDADCPRELARGVWKYHDLAGYTSVGAGSCIVDVRINCPPEIVLHRLRCL